MRDYDAETLILDIRLPGISKWDMLKQIAAESGLPDIPLIILTASSLTTQSSEQVYPNIAAIVTRPIGVTELLLAVKKSLDSDVWANEKNVDPGRRRRSKDTQTADRQS